MTKPHGEDYTCTKPRALGQHIGINQITEKPNPFKQKFDKPLPPTPKRPPVNKQTVEEKQPDFAWISKLEGNHILTEYLQTYIKIINEYIKKNNAESHVVMEEWIREQMMPESLPVLLNLNTPDHKSVKILKAIIALTTNELTDDTNQSIDLYDTHYRLLSRIQNHLTK